MDREPSRAAHYPDLLAGLGQQGCRSTNRITKIIMRPWAVVDLVPAAAAGPPLEPLQFVNKGFVVQELDVAGHNQRQGVKKNSAFIPL